MQTPIIAGSRARGFTFPEVLVTIALLVIFSGLLGTVFFQAQSSVLRMEKQSRELQERLTLASFLPRLCQEIRPPYWANPEAIFTQTSEGLLVRYWDGDSEKSMSIQTTGGELEVTTPSGAWKWSTLVDPVVRFWTRDERVIGLELSWGEGENTQVVHFPWGARTL